MLIDSPCSFFRTYIINIFIIYFIYFMCPLLVEGFLSSARMYLTH